MLQHGSERPSFGGFRLWAIVNNVAVNTGVQVALKALLPILLGIHRSEAVESHGNSWKRKRQSTSALLLENPMDGGA